VLVQELDPQPGRRERRDDLADRVLPLDPAAVRELGTLGRVRPRSLLHPGATGEVVVRHPRAGLGVEHVGERVELGEVQEPAGRHQRRGGLGPAPDVGQPAQRADAGVHDVVRRVRDRVRRVVHVRRDERRPVRAEAEVPGQSPGQVDRGFGEVEPDDTGGAVPGPGQRVESDVALEVQQGAVADLAHLGELEVAQGLLTGPEGVEVVEITRDVQRDPLVPVGAVGLVPVGRGGGVQVCDS
jgi:hypothetical protein